MTAPAVTPGPGLTNTVVTADNPVIAVGANPGGGFIVNPPTAPGYLYVDPVGAAGTAAAGTTFGLAPGQNWDIIPGQTTPTSVNSQSDGHTFSVVTWPNT